MRETILKHVVLMAIAACMTACAVAPQPSTSLAPEPEVQSIASVPLKQYDRQVPPRDVDVQGRAPDVSLPLPMGNGNGTTALFSMEEVEVKGPELIPYTIRGIVDPEQPEYATLVILQNGPRSPDLNARISWMEAGCDGYEIVQVNGRDVASMTNRATRKLIYNDQNSVQLTIRRRGSVRVVEHYTTRLGSERADVFTSRRKSSESP